MDAFADLASLPHRKTTAPDQNRIAAKASRASQPEPHDHRAHPPSTQPDQGQRKTTTPECPRQSHRLHADDVAHAHSVSRRRPREDRQQPRRECHQAKCHRQKNWLFIGEAEAGQRSAILFTIIEACRSRGIDPQTYLRELLARLPTLTNRQIKEVTPEAWAKTRRIDGQQKAA
jgi:hypothetical protein